MIEIIIGFFTVTEPVAKLRAGTGSFATGSTVKRRFRAIVAVILPIALLLTSGCATGVETAPFRLFSQTVQYTGNTMEGVMRTTGNLFRDEFIRDFSAGTDAHLSELKVKTTGRFSWEMQHDAPPVFVRIQQSRVALILLNETLNSYSELLLKLADDKLLTPGVFSQLEKSLNRGAVSAFRALAPEQPPSAPAILSQAASDLMQHYLESKRRRYLADAIRQNHPNVEVFSGLARELVLKCRNDVKRYYTNETARLFEQWTVAAKDQKQKEREKLVRAMIDLNMQFVNTLDLLDALDAAYAALPSANADLAIAVEQPGCSLSGLEQLLQASRLTRALQR